ncbi:Hydroxymethylpyrimidine synthesis protein THI5 [Legionella pneumophila subsp. pneumophila LPE509]|nr:Hydroxymethylpyrimidine synthesis protein THI5 [Legionella pneumophila subsp. pneumophila LPE509]
MVYQLSSRVTLDFSDDIAITPYVIILNIMEMAKGNHALKKPWFF